MFQHKGMAQDITEQLRDKNIVLFDGVCNLCNGSVNFLIDNDKRNKLHFASLQSGFGQQVLAHFGMAQHDFDTFLFVKKGERYVRSRAAIEVMRTLGGAWQAATVLLLVPRFVRDAVYRWVSAHRYRLFGKSEQCRLPTPALRAKFLEDARIAH